nr:IgGFc-binding protein-like [Misgurnus anguillicaudatus]
MFAILLIVSMFSQGLTIVSYGNNFITAFPENIAYFYPNTSSSLRVTALLDGTSVDIFYNGDKTPTKTISNMQKGQTAVVVFPKSAEVYQLDYSTKSIRINSNKFIAVHSLTNTISTLNEKSYQSNVVQPNENLDTHYLIPSLNYTNLVTTFGLSQSAFWSKRYGLFKLVIINAEDTENSITIVKNILGSIQLVKFTIPSYQLIQLQADDSMMMVNSSHKIAVLLTHPCLDNTDCTCSMIVNQILPVRFQGQNFVVPSIPDINQRQLVMTSNDKTSSLSQNSNQLTPSSSGFLSLSDLNNQYVTASSSVSLKLIISGNFIELIPENMFSACYLLQHYSTSRKALVIAKTNEKAQVQAGSNPITGTGWTLIPNSVYSSTEVTLTDQTTIIWHPSSKIAVYILDAFWTGPAIPINDNPDPNGCTTPGDFVVGNQPLKWTESLDYCTNHYNEFACPTDEDLQMDLANSVDTTDAEGWIGLRRSLMTKAWYWQTSTTSASSPPVNYVYWANGQPQNNTMGFCASLSLDGKDDFKWKSASCCEEKLPVCYKRPIIFVPIFPLMET